MKTLTPKRVSLGERTPGSKLGGSPNPIRISGLQERFQTESGASRLKGSLSPPFNQQVMLVHDRLNKTCEKNQQKFEDLAERMASLRQGLAKLSDLRAGITEGKRNDLSQIELNYRKETRLEYEDHVGKTNSICEDLLNSLDHLQKSGLKEIGEAKKAQLNISDSLARHLGELRAEFNSQKEHRERFYDNLIDKMGSDILKLNRNLAEEQRERQESHADILRGIKAMRDRFVVLIEVAFAN